MKRFYLAGHTNFGNRGCEALVRSTLDLLKVMFDGEAIEILVPSFNVVSDSKHWPQALKDGVVFVPVVEFPAKLKWWNRLNRIASITKSLWIPDFEVPEKTSKQVISCDAIIMIGGDVISLDYGLAPLLWNISFADYFLKKNIPTILWAASVGPFSQEPIIEKYMSSFLQRLAFITVRETFSQQYLDKIGVAKNVTLVADPAFALAAEKVDTSEFWPRPSVNGVLGFNISYLVEKFRSDSDENVLFDEVTSFLLETINNKKMSVILVPHVDSPEGKHKNDDSQYMANIMARMPKGEERIRLVTPGLNAVQLKYVIGQCRFFIGARTHSTIAALSLGVPTMSIAYSVKAKGLNKDLFGDERYVLETPSVNRVNLIKGLDALFADEIEIKKILKERIPIWKENALLSARKMMEHLNIENGK